jgi:hypothetical protein
LPQKGFQASLKVSNFERYFIFLEIMEEVLREVAEA